MLLVQSCCKYCLLYSAWKQRFMVSGHIYYAFCQIREIQTLKLILDLKWLAEDFMH